MRKIIYITFAAVLVLLSSESFAQDKNEKGRRFDREAFEAKRNAFITAEVGLTPEEAEIFIPLCNELRQKLFEAGRQNRKLARQILKKEHPTDEEYLQLIDTSLAVEMQEAQIEKDYYEKFKKVISPEKLFKYRQAEMKFARNFMKSKDKLDNMVKVKE